MKNRRSFALIRFGLAALLLGAAVAFLALAGAPQALSAAHAQAAAQQTARLAPTQAGNYCTGCHVENDPYLAAYSPWQTTLGAAQADACPAALRIQEELYYTERMLIMIERSQAALPANVDLGAAPGRLAAGQAGFARLLDTPTHSLLAYNSEAQMLRYDLNKVYSQLMAAETGLRRQRILMGSLAVTAAILLSLAWGFRNTQTAGAGRRLPVSTRSLILAGIALVLIFGMFALPIFRSVPQTVASASEEELERAATLDEAQRAADAAERALARAAMLGKIGAAWYPYDSAQGEAALEAALEAAAEANADAAALWGEAQAAKEAAAGLAVETEKANNVAAALEAVQGRAWAYRQIAEAWQPLDSDRAAAILETGWRQTANGQGLFRDLDRRALAVTWAKIDPARAGDLLAQVDDPALRAWGWRELAAQTGDPTQVQKAAESAAQIADPLARAHSLARIVRAAGDRSYAPAALQAIEATTLEGRAYAMAALAAAAQDAALAGAAQDPALAGEISPDYPEARILAWIGVGDFTQVSEEAARLTDPFTHDRLLAAAAVAAQDPGLADEIFDPLWRDKALWEIIQISGKLSLAESLELPYYQVQALTAQEQFDLAWQSAETLKEPYPLSALAQRWAPVDTQAALAVIEALEREADKAAPLKAVALAAPEDYQAFERALGMALAARVRNNALAPAQASLDLALAFAQAGHLEQAQAAFEQAVAAAERISIQ